MRNSRQVFLLAALINSLSASYTNPLKCTNVHLFSCKRSINSSSSFLVNEGKQNLFQVSILLMCSNKKQHVESVDEKYIRKRILQCM